MRNIKVVRVYNLVNSKGNKLQLRLGILKSREGEVCISNADKGYRWSFIGENIPMPVRSMYWFNGFEESIMLDWLKGNGWYPRSCVFMDDGRARIYELPDAEPAKGNEETTKVYEVPSYVKVAGENAFKDAIRYLCNNVNRMTAVCMYRYVHPCSLGDAKNAVDAIWFDEQK